MSKLSFEEEKLSGKSNFGFRNNKRTSSFESLVIKTGLVNSAKGAKTVLLVLALALLILSFILLKNKDSAAKYGNYDEMLRTHPELTE